MNLARSHGNVYNDFDYVDNVHSFCFFIIQSSLDLISYIFIRHVDCNATEITWRWQTQVYL